MSTPNSTPKSSIDEQDRRARLQIQQQLARSQQTLVALGRAGLEPQHVVALDFTFVAPSAATANALRAYLDKNHCHDTSVTPIAGDASGRHHVKGRSAPTKIDARILGQWVPWMVVQGVKHDCEFEGWGTQVPR